jgi:prephenate dehydratase
VIAANEIQTTPPNKTSLRFETPHAPGSLAKVLNMFCENEMNMTKIQSVPIQGQPYQYSFHVDLEWQSDKKLHSVMTELKRLALNVIHFGNYPRGERPEA